ncbi:MAG: alpha/beta hydrolase [Sphingomonadales bacterium]|nr:MAG: alpha/beta hydrolase [Sphingomonadales bacterium]
MTKATGWRRFWRWVKRVLLGLLALLILVTIVGTIYEALGRKNAAAKYPPPGKLVDIGGRKMHIDCRGTGSPTVILESGLGTGGTLDWTLVHDEIARFTRTCAYDRAGIMWSDPKDTPQDAAAVTEDLHALLKGAGITDQLALVGHSIGGPYTRTYTGKYGDQVAGLVMVDPSQPDQVARLGKATGLDVHPKQASTLMHTAKALAWTGLVRFVIARGEKPKLRNAAETKRLGDALAISGAYTSSSIRGSTSELDGYDRTQKQARAVQTFGNRPLIVLTAMAPFKPEQLKGLKMKAEQGARFKQEWKALHAEQAAFSTRGHQQLVPDATHYIQVDRPEVVIAAVREVVDTVRADAQTAAKK